MVEIVSHVYIYFDSEEILVKVYNQLYNGKLRHLALDISHYVR